MGARLTSEMALAAVLAISHAGHEDTGTTLLLVSERSFLCFA